MKLSGKVALVTGGARRVGAAIVQELVSAGTHVALHHHTSSQEAHALAAALSSSSVEVVPFQADLQSTSQIDQLFEDVDRHFGGLDILVSNASLFQRTPLATSTLEAWQQSLQVNLTAPFWCARLAAPRMQARGEGVILHLADIAGERGWPGYAAYSCAKAGLLMLTQVLALELAPLIRVNAIAPGTVLWPDDMDRALQERLVARIPLQRIGTPEAVAQAARFLIEQDFITGEVLRIDGGRAVRP